VKPLAAPNLDDIPGVAHGFFTRGGGVSSGIFASLNCGPGSSDARDAVIENRRIALSSLCPERDAQLVTIYQVHSADALCVQDPWAVDNPPRADAMASDRPGIALGILTADCAPVLLADGQAGVVGAAHAGWRGALSGIVGSVVHAMESLGARRERIAAAVGPCIGQQSYEVGSDFRIRFLEADRANEQYFNAGIRPAHWMFDLESFVTDCLKREGVENVARLGACTYAQEGEFFSFRRATHRGEADYGRQLSAIMLKI
jgi:YfiH family protein